MPCDFKLSKPNNPTRRVSFAEAPSWNALAERIQQLYNIPAANIAVTYVDEDGDEITLNSEDELADFYRASYTDGQTIRFTVQNLRPSDDSQAHGSRHPVFEQEDMRNIVGSLETAARDVGDAMRDAQAAAREAANAATEAASTAAREAATGAAEAGTHTADAARRIMEGINQMLRQLQTQREHLTSDPFAFASGVWGAFGDGGRGGHGHRGRGMGMRGGRGGRGGRHGPGFPFGPGMPWDAFFGSPTPHPPPPPPGAEAHAPPPPPPEPMQQDPSTSSDGDGDGRRSPPSHGPHASFWSRSGPQPGFQYSGFQYGGHRGGPHHGPGGRGDFPAFNAGPPGGFGPYGGFSGPFDHEAGPSRHRPHRHQHGHHHSPDSRPPTPPSPPSPPTPPSPRGFPPPGGWEKL